MAVRYVHHVHASADDARARCKTSPSGADDRKHPNIQSEQPDGDELAPGMDVGQSTGPG